MLHLLKRLYVLMNLQEAFNPLTLDKGGYHKIIYEL